MTELNFQENGEAKDSMEGVHIRLDLSIELIASKESRIADLIERRTQIEKAIIELLKRELGEKGEDRDGVQWNSARISARPIQVDDDYILF